MDVDNSGFNLLKERIECCPQVLEAMFDLPISVTLPKVYEHYVVTGIGSSAAHAKFFANLINNCTPCSASFIELSAFYKPMATGQYEQSALVVFSQGLSNNALLPLKQKHLFEHTILFTATTIEGAAASGKTDKQDILKELVADGDTIVHFPIENENDLLIRVIGPIAGYLAVIQFVDSIWPEVIGELNQSELLTVLSRAKEKVVPGNVDLILDGLDKGSVVMGAYPVVEFADNLACKVYEGLYRPMPVICDTLAFAHGPFQELIGNPRPVFYFMTGTREQRQLFEKARQMLEDAKCPIWEIESSLPMPWAILEYEMIMNYFLVHTFEGYAISQKEWPGKGLDGPLYNIKDPLS